MKIGMIAQGSNGDVEILVSLALGLVKNSHEVELLIITINNRDYSFLNQNKGLKVHQKFVHAEFKTNQNDLDFWDKPEEDKSVIYNKLYDKIKKDLVDYSYKFSKGKDIVIGLPYLFDLAFIAEKFNTPYISVNFPLEDIRTIDGPPFKLENFENLTINEQWEVYEQYYNAASKRIINKIRKEHGLNPVRHVLEETVNTHFLNLIPYSKYLYKANLYRENSYQICGYLKSPENYNTWIPPADLLSFLEGEEKPVLITVGSMEEHENDLQNFQNILLSAALLIRRKVIILSNWEHGNTIEANVYELKGFVSYPAILSRCCLVVHHGGMGILHHATEAGCPSIVIKYGHDQPYNAKLLFDLGISNGSIDRRDLNTDELARLINSALDNKQMKQKAEELASLLQQENGVKNAVALIERKVTENIISLKMNV